MEQMQASKEQQTSKDAKLIKQIRNSTAKLEYNNVVNKIEARKIKSDIFKGCIIVGACGAMALYSGDIFVSTLSQPVSMDGYMKLFSSGAICNASTLGAIITGIHMVAKKAKELAFKSLQTSNNNKELYINNRRENALIERIIKDYSHE